MRRILLPCATALARAAACACFLAAGAQAQAPPTDAELHLLVLLPDTLPADAPLGAVHLTRGVDGWLFVSVAGRGLVAYAPGTAEGVRPRTSEEAAIFGGPFSWLGDTLAVGRYQSWTLLANGRDVVGCRAIREPGNEFAVQVFEERLLAGGRLIGEELPPWPEVGIPPRVVLARGQWVLRVLATLDPEPAPLEVPFPRGNGHWSVLPPLQGRSVWHAADDGSGIVYVEQRAPAEAGTAPVRVVRLRATGEPVYSTALRLPAIPVSQGWREADLRSMATRGALPPRDTAAAVEAFREVVEYPPFHPAVAGVVAGTGGSAWLRLASEDDHAEWLRLDATGREAERIRLPSAFQAVYADRDGLWGARRVAGGIQLLHAGTGAGRYRPLLAPPPPAEGPRRLGCGRARELLPAAGARRPGLDTLFRGREGAFFLSDPQSRRFLWVDAEGAAARIPQRSRSDRVLERIRRVERAYDEGTATVRVTEEGPGHRLVLVEDEGPDDTGARWLDGWVERGEDVYFFVLETDRPAVASPDPAALVRRILGELGLLEGAP